MHICVEIAPATDAAWQTVVPGSEKSEHLSTGTVRFAVERVPDRDSKNRTHLLGEQCEASTPSYQRKDAWSIRMW